MGSAVYYSGVCEAVVTQKRNITSLFNPKRLTREKYSVVTTMNESETGFWFRRVLGEIATEHYRVLVLSADEQKLIVHTGQVASPSQGHTETNNHTHPHS